ncbi:MAG: hypothetical protein AB1726_15470 [Planctomycetota bacterium]
MPRRPAPALPLLPPLVLFLGACAAPPLAGEPWERASAGTLGIGVRPALFTIYGIEGEFVTQNFDPPPPEIVSTDDGDIRGRFGLAVEGQCFLTDRLVASAGVDFRAYDIENLTPSPELTVEVERIESRQYYGSLRYLFPPLAAGGRLRPFAQVSLAWLPEVDVGFVVDLSEYGSSNLDIETAGEGAWVGGLAAGLVYQWRDRWLLEAGLAYERALRPLEADLGFDIGPQHVPMDAEFAPAGWVGSAGLSLFF